MYIFYIGIMPLPITPGALTIKTPSMNVTKTLINDGEINIPKLPGLREISFEFLLPQIQKYPFAQHVKIKGGFNFSLNFGGFSLSGDQSGINNPLGNGGGLNNHIGGIGAGNQIGGMSTRGIMGSQSIGAVGVPDDPTSGGFSTHVGTQYGGIGLGYTPDMENNTNTIIPLLNKWKDTKLPIQFIVCRTTPIGEPLLHTNIKCLIEEFTFNEDANEYGMDIMCSITLKEYKPYGTKSMPVNNGKPTQKNYRPNDNREIPSQMEAPQHSTLPNTHKRTNGTYNGSERTADANNIAKPVDITPEEVSTYNDAKPNTDNHYGTGYEENLNEADQRYADQQDGNSPLSYSDGSHELLRNPLYEGTGRTDWATGRHYDGENTHPDVWRPEGWDPDALIPLED